MTTTTTKPAPRQGSQSRREERGNPLSSERSLRAYASHLALQTRGPKGGPFTLFEKYGGKRKVGGPYRSLAALERGIVRYGDDQLRRLADEPE
jgi:hypothetical protein